MKKSKIIVVCGPTATGKSDYAVKLAREISGEIISADSRQVYVGLDIGSGKITRKEMRGVQHYMLDVVSPKKIFSVVDFQKKGRLAIEKILKKNKTPILCGGTGFYIDALIYDKNFPTVPINKTLRTKLEKLSLGELGDILKKLDKKRWSEIDLKNKVRVVRAIEIAQMLGKVPKVNKQKLYDVEWVYLDFPDQVLKQRIHARLMKRVKMGMTKEVIDLHKSGISWVRLESLGLEYRYLALFLQKKISKTEMLAQLENAIWHYAKRQRTWFKKYAK